MSELGEYKGKKILLLDFDGVLHYYRNGWKGPGIIDDDPVPGAVEFVTEAVKHFRVMVYSSRSHYIDGIPAMRAWLNKHGFPEVEFPKGKPPAHLTIDDRCVDFNGVFPTMDYIENFEPWFKTLPTGWPIG